MEQRGRRPVNPITFRRGARLSRARQDVIVGAPMPPVDLHRLVTSASASPGRCGSRILRRRGPAAAFLGFALVAFATVAAAEPDVSDSRARLERSLQALAVAPPGLDLRTAQSPVDTSAAKQAPIAAGTLIPDEDVAKLLSRLPAQEEVPATSEGLVLRPGTAPPPRTGEVVRTPFPPPPGPAPPVPARVAQPLEVLRWKPEGEVTHERNVTVVFNQPMVALTSAEESAKTTPVRLAPEPPGRWSWLDPKTLQFRPDVRFPHSTTYEVEVPAGTSSLAGTTLAEAKTFRFETPTLKIASSYPNASKTRPITVPMVILFDQSVDAAALLVSHVKVTANGNPLRVRLLEAAELAAAEKSDTELASFLAEPRKAGHESRLLALAPEAGELPRDSAIAIEISAGAASTEGPNRTKIALLTGFRTYAPLRIVGAGCYYQECNEHNSYTIRFNNRLAKEAHPENEVRVSPDVADLEVTHDGDTIDLSGSPRPRTAHTVTLSGRIRDVHGQTLGDDQIREWKTGDVEAKLDGPWGLQVLEPAQPGREPVLELRSRRFPRLDVRLYRVETSDYAAFDSAMYRYLDEDEKERREPPGTEVFHEIVRPQDSGDEVAITRIPLAPALNDAGFGHVVAVVEPIGSETGYGDRVITWLQSTRLGIDAVIDTEGVAVLVTELATGAPAAGVEVTLQPAGTTARTDERGMVTVPSGNVTSLGRIVVRRGKDTAFLEGPSSYGGYGYLTSRKSEMAWYVIDDRGTYRPGEEVTLKGWIRTVDHRKRGDVDHATGLQTVSYVVRDAQGTRIGEGSATVSANGSFDTRFKLPTTPNLGTATVEIHAQGTQLPGNARYTHGFEIREFRRPEYEVSASAGEGPHLLGGSADVTVKAGYFAGGPLPQAPVKWSLVSSRASFVPPGREDYEFGDIPSWYGGYEDAGEGDGSGYFKAEKSWSADGITDSNGTHSLRLDLPSARPALPMTVSVEAEVRDVNRQAWTGKTKLLVHPGDLYVGLRVHEGYIEKGASTTVSVIGVDHDGAMVSGAAIELEAYREERNWNPATNAYDSSRSDGQRCFVTSAAEPVTCTFQANERGSYTIDATIVDSKGRASQTEASFYASSYETEPSRSVEQEKIELVADRKEYAPGDTARVSISAPFYPAEAVVTVQRSGVLETRRLRLERPSTVEVAITEAMLPNVYVQVDAVGSVPRPSAGSAGPKPPRPAYATGELELKVPPKVRTLDVRVLPGEASVAPAAQTSLGVEVRDASGTPVEGAEVAVFVVDEAILALGNHRLPHPVASFYPRRSDGTYELHSREYVRLAEEEGQGGAYGESAEMEGSPFGTAPPLFLRKDFDPLAAFFPALVTGADGRASATFKLPDSVTRYRIFAVAASGAKRFGKGESTLAARLALVVRPSAPRFLNFGDVFELPVVVQNQTDRASAVRVALRTQNLELTAGAGREVTIPANDRVEVRFPAAANMAGEAAFQVVAVGDAGEDAAAVKLPVWTPATTEAFATYGVLDEGAVHQPVTIPAEVWEDFGGLDVTTSSTNLQALTDAFLYLVRYPYECGEQIASRMLAIVALQDVLAAFRAPELPKPEALRQQLTKDVLALLKKQKTNGGFVFWSAKDDPADPYVSIHATNALVRARARGIEVPAEPLANALRYIANIEPTFATGYTESMRRVLSAFALHTRSLAGDVDVDKARKLVEQAGGADKLPLEAAGWLLGTLATQDVPEKKALVRHILNRATETAGAASFTSDYEDVGRLLLASDRRTDAIVLEALIAAEPALDLIPRVVTGLLAHRKAGRWLNTQENVYILLALDRYFRTYENVEPDFVAQIWLGSDYAGEHAFKGRTTESREVSIPTREVVKHSGQSLVISKKGEGRLYYRAGIRLAPKSFAIGPMDRGFIVERRYEGADDPADVVRQGDGSWKIRLGARVRVIVQAFNEARRYQVALVDPLPAGLEPIAPKVSPESNVVYGCWFEGEADFYNWWNPVWFQHQNLRDERAEAFTSLLAPGDHVYEYVARATTPGTFVVPPARAEEMYMPETFGRSASTRVVVE
jgi:uncharacterized protein YfaS (alpha-2-macroglobulin family)